MLETVKKTLKYIFKVIHEYCTFGNHKTYDDVYVTFVSKS